MVLIEWIDQLHSSPSVNVIRYMKQLLRKFLFVIGAQEDDKSALGKKALEQLRYFLEDLKDASYRTLQLDSEVIPILTEFLLNCDETKQIAILCSLDWLNHFIDFFREDFLSALDRARALKMENDNSGLQQESMMNGSEQQILIEEETKDPISAVDVGTSQVARPGGLLINTGADGAVSDNHESGPGDYFNDLRMNKNQYLDQGTNKLLRAMYTKQFPDIISTILRLKHSKKINDIDCKRLVENINGRFLRTVIQILSERDEFEHIFHRLKKEYEQVQRQGGEKQEAIIQWYTELFKEFSEDLIEQHQDVFQGLIINLNFENSRLVKRIMNLVCMMSTKNGDYSRKVMSQLIDRFHIIRSQPKFDDKIKQVIQELCNSISSEQVFMEFASKLENHMDLVFQQELIERLTLVIAASPQYKTLRDILMGK